MLGEVCTKWYDLGLELFDTKDERKLGIIEENNKIHGVEKCCTKMFEKWLEYDDAHVSWDILVKAIRKIGLHHLASQIEKLFMCKTMHIIIIIINFSDKYTTVLLLIV